MNKAPLLYIPTFFVYIPPAYLPLDEQFLKTTSFILKATLLEVMNTAAVVVLIDSNTHFVILVASLNGRHDSDAKNETKSSIEANKEFITER